MITVETVLLDKLWPGLTVWGLLYMSDYGMTLAGARLRQHVSDRIVSDGSYELTPYFQADIDGLRVVSPRFLAALAYGCAYLTAAWWLAAQTLPRIYDFLLGAMISVELAIHVRHLRNIFLFRGMRRTDSVQGRIQYSRSLILESSSVEFFGFSALFAVLSAFTASWFLLGGTARCFIVAVKHWKQANKYSQNGETAKVAAVGAVE